MTKDLLKTILAGIIAGITIFTMPFFIIQLIIFLIVMKIISKLLGFHSKDRFWKKFQNMSDEEITSFKENFKLRCQKFNS